VIVFPNGKINLGLNIVEKRADGYHNLETLFFPIAFRDILEITPSTAFEFKTYGMPISGDTENNLCVKAYRLLSQKFPELPPIQTGLYKNIPMGAGLGGGSADGAFMLRLLSNLFHLKISEDQLIQLAVQLGSDCPFFLLNTPCLASGRGELLEPMTLRLENFLIVLVNPGISVSTAWAFSKIRPSVPTKSIREIISQPIDSWRNSLMNDFESPVFAEYPSLKMIKEKMYALGAVYASMSGSGSSIFGIFDKKIFRKENPEEKLKPHGQVVVTRSLFSPVFKVIIS